MKKRYLSVLANLTLILSLALAPVASFADAPGHHPDDRDFFSKMFATHGGAKLTYAAGNASSSSTDLPPVISGITAPTVLAAGTEGTWTVNASDPENGSLSYAVDWGDTSIFGRMMAFIKPQQVFTQTSTFTHTYAKDGTYTITFTVKDAAGHSEQSSVTVHVAAQTPALAISDVGATSTKPTHATVSWMTNVRSDSQVFYASSTPVDTSTAATAGNKGGVLSHKIMLTKLSPGTTYHYVVRSTTASGDVVTSSESSFTTPTVATNGAPTIESVSGPDTLALETLGTWTVNASDPENGSLSYAVDWGDTSIFGRMMAFIKPQQVFTQTSTFTHTYAKDGTYTITFTVKDAAGKTAVEHASVTVTKVSTTQPIISALSALVNDASIVFNWNTNEAADTEVYYSSASPVVVGATGTTAVTDSTLGTSHSIEVPGLTANTNYHFLVRSQDGNGHATTAPEFSLTTMGI